MVVGIVVGCVSIFVICLIGLAATLCYVYYVRGGWALEFGPLPGEEPAEDAAGPLSPARQITAGLASPSGAVTVRATTFKGQMKKQMKKRAQEAAERATLQPAEVEVTPA